MDEFEKIYNSIYANNYSENESSDYKHINDSSSDNAGLSNKQKTTDDDYLSAYDLNRKPVASESIRYDDSLDINDASMDNESFDNESESVKSVPKSKIFDEITYEPEYSDKEDFDIDDYEDAFSNKSFLNYLSVRLAGIIIKLRGGVPPEATTATGEEDTDDLGEEIPFIDASKYYGGYVHSLKLRTTVAGIVLFVLMYISIGLPVTGRLNSIIIASLTCMALQFNIILLSLDVFTNGITNMFRGRFGADSLCVVSCIITTIDAVLVISGQTDSHVPLCLISSISLYGILLSSTLSSRGLRKALRVPGISSIRYTVTGEIGVTGKEITLLKSNRNTDGFLRRIEEEPVDENLYRRLSPIIIIFTIILSAVITILKKNYTNAIYIFSAIYSISIPFSALLCYSLPFFISAHKLFPFGAALAGWSGITDIGHSKNLIITDRDLFPPKSISIEEIKIFADYDKGKVISYACSMIRESKCDLDVAFTEIAEQNNAEQLRVDNFECLASGGLKGMIEGKNILCGNADFMRLMNIKVPSKLVNETTVLLSIDGILYGIFPVKYKPLSKVRKALVNLMGSNRHAIFAVRDFNITPDMLHDCFDIATDGYDFPAYRDRFPLSEAQASNDSKIAGILCRGGLEPLIKLADTGRNVFVITKTNLVISIVSAFLGAIFVSLVLFLGNGITVLGMFLYQLVASAPVIILSLFGSTLN